MARNTYLMLLFLIASTFLIENVVNAKGRYRDYDYGNNNHNNYGNNNNNNNGKRGGNSQLNEQKTNSKFMGNSSTKFRWTAWRIVALIVGAILMMVATYYLFICYPIICKEERKYDRIELSSV